MSSAKTNAVAGSVQATLVTITGYPFDFIKARMQTGRYNNSWECLKETIFKEGPKTLYRGCSMPWISHLLKRPLQYPISEYMKERQYSNNYVIGGSTGIIGSIVGTPLQVVKVSMQTSSKKEHSSLSQFIRFNYYRHGWKGFYRGFLPTLVKDITFGAAFIGNYYTFRDYLGTDHWTKNFLSGAAAHCLCWATLMPIDYVKTTIQRSNRHLTVSRVVKNTITKHGLSRFWRGLVPACARTVPVSGIAMIGYEATRQYLSKDIKDRKE